MAVVKDRVKVQSHLIFLAILHTSLPLMFIYCCKDYYTTDITLHRIRN